LKRGVIVVLVVGIAAALGFVVQHQLGKEPVATAVTTASTAPSATAPPAADAAAEPPKPVIPTTLPQFELADRDGKKRTLGDWKGRPVMVNYWATWCPPCRKEIPLLNQLRADHKAQKLEIIGIAVDFREDVLKYAQEHPITYPLLINDDENMVAMKAMGLPNAPFPFTVFADSQQRIVAIRFAELHRDVAELILERVARIDAGTLTLEEARKQIEEGLKQIDMKRAAAPAAAG
jgi:thiol-disulfide isomerase/thioredoxin